ADIQLRGGPCRRVVWDTTSLQNESGAPAGIAAIGRDVTAQRALESRVVQTEKLDTIGRMAAGIAHDFNNLLAVIMGHVALTLEQVNSSDPLHETLISVQSAASDCAALTDQLLAIGRRQNLQAEVMSLNTVITDGEDLLKRQAGPRI